MKNVLVVGATGNLGPHIVKELTDQGKHVSALMRSASIHNPDKTEALKNLGVQLIEGDLKDTNSLKKACEGQDAIISCAGAEHILDQIALAQVAAKSGAQRFIPSEFGLDPIAVGPGSCALFDMKASVHEPIKDTGIGFTPIYTHCFMEFWATGLGQLGPMAPPDRVQVFGDGNTSTYMVALPDIARYTIAILDDPNTVNRDIRIRAHRTNQNDLISLWENISGRSVMRQKVSGEDLNEIINTSTTPDTMIDRIFAELHRSCWIRGEGNLEREDVLDADQLYPEIQPVGLKDYLGYFVK